MKVALIELTPVNLFIMSAKVLMHEIRNLRKRNLTETYIDKNVKKLILRHLF